MSTTPEGIVHRFTNHPPSSDIVGGLLDELTARFIELGTFLDDHLPTSREGSLALTKLEEDAVTARGEA